MPRFIYIVVNSFVDCVNQDVNIQRIGAEHMEAHRNHLRKVIEEYVAETGSQRGQEILKAFADKVGKFWLVKPKAASLDSLLEDLLEVDDAWDDTFDFDQIAEVAW